MLDIETMGIDESIDDIIQIGLLELYRDNTGFYHPGRSYERLLHTSQSPKNDWITTHHRNKLSICKKLPKVPAENIRQDILSFFWRCGVTEFAQIMGLNLHSLDLPFMLRDGYLKKSDYHYRIYELKGAFNVAQDILNCDSKDLFTRAELFCPVPFGLPEGNGHDALYDCYRQVKTLNGVIHLLRQRA